MMPSRRPWLVAFAGWVVICSIPPRTASAAGVTAAPAPVAPLWVAVRLRIEPAPYPWGADRELVEEFKRYQRAQKEGPPGEAARLRRGIQEQVDAIRDARQQKRAAFELDGSA